MCRFSVIVMDYKSQRLGVYGQLQPVFIAGLVQHVLDMTLDSVTTLDLPDMIILFFLNTAPLCNYKVSLSHCTKM